MTTVFTFATQHIQKNSSSNSWRKKLRVTLRFSLLALLSSLMLSSSPATAQEKVDLDAITKIRYEGCRNSKIMQHASEVIDRIGARLTCSPIMKRASERTRDKHSAVRVVNAHLQRWLP